MDRAAVRPLCRRLTEASRMLPFVTYVSHDSEWVALMFDNVAQISGDRTYEALMESGLDSPFHSNSRRFSTPGTSSLYRYQQHYPLERFYSSLVGVDSTNPGAWVQNRSTLMTIALNISGG